MTATRIHAGGAKPTGCRSDTIGGKLRHFRLQRNLSQLELAEGICSTQLISAIERGATNPRVSTLAKLADRLKVPLHEIYRPADEDFPNAVKLELVDAYLKRDELDMAEEMLEILKQRGDLVEVERQTLVLLECEVLNKRNLPMEAVHMLKPVLETAEIKQNIEDELLCKLYNQLGNAYYYLRDFAKAYSAYQRAYQLSLRFPVFNMIAANVSYNLGIVSTQLELDQDAESYLEMARDYYESVSDIRKSADAYFHSAIATKDASYLVKAKNLYETLECFEMIQLARQHQAFYVDSKIDYKKSLHELLSTADEFHDLRQEELSLLSRTRAAMLCLEHQDFKFAQSLLERATQFKENHQLEEGQCIPYYHLVKARYHLQTQDFDSCLQEAQKSALLYSTMGMHMNCSDALEVMVSAYQLQGRFEEALQASRRMNELLRRREGEKH